MTSLSSARPPRLLPRELPPSTARFEPTWPWPLKSQGALKERLIKHSRGWPEGCWKLGWARAAACRRGNLSVSTLEVTPRLYSITDMKI